MSRQLLFLINSVCPNFLQLSIILHANLVFWLTLRQTSCLKNKLLNTKIVLNRSFAVFIDRFYESCKKFGQTEIIKKSIVQFDQFLHATSFFETSLSHIFGLIN